MKLVQNNFLSQISQNYPDIYSYQIDKMRNGNFQIDFEVEEVRSEEVTQAKVNSIVAKTEYESSPAFVAGKMLRNIYDFFFPAAFDSKQTSNLRAADTKKKLLTTNGGTLNQTQLQEIVNSRRSNSSNGFVDLSDLSGLTLKGEPFSESTDDDLSGNANATDDDALGNINYQPIQVFRGLNVSRSNFGEVFPMRSLYFYNSDFSFVPLKNMSSVFFDGCNLSSADMSNSTHSHTYLAGVSSQFLAWDIMETDLTLHNLRDQPNSAEYLVAFEKMQKLKDAHRQLPATIFHNVNLKGTKFTDGVYDNFRTDYKNTSWKGVIIDTPFTALAGRNLDLNGSYQKLSNGQYFEITKAVSAEQIEAEAGPYVADMLRNNLVRPRPLSGKKTVIAVAGSGLNSDINDVTDLCNKEFSQEVTYSPINISDTQTIIDTYNRNYAERYNVEFVADDQITPYDFRINFCNNAAINGGGRTNRLGLVERENFIEVNGFNPRYSINIELHEGGHMFGSHHPFETGILPTQCVSFASAVCYGGGMDLMLRLGKENNPLKIKYIPEIGEQDHQMAAVVFGVNPNYQSHEIRTNITLGQNRIIKGDAGYDNIALLDTSSLPHNVGYAVIDAASAIGTCYQFPCDPKELDKGLSGSLIVFYQKDDANAFSALGNSLIFGGKNNQVIVDGKVVKPMRLAPILKEPPANLTEILQNNTQLIDFGYNRYTVNEVNVTEAIDLAGTDLRGVDLNGKYFRNCNFAGCRFGNTSDIIFDGCDLTGADFSDTTQSNLMLGAEVLFIARTIAAIDGYLHRMTSSGSYSQSDYDESLKELKMMQDRLAQITPTKFVEVNLSGATLLKPSDNYLTDYSGTDFTNVKIAYDEVVNTRVYAAMMGQNLDLNGALYRLPSGEYFEITNAIPAAEVGRESGKYLEAMLRNNLINPLSGKKTRIAIASTISENVSETSNRCTEIFDTDSAFVPVNVTDLQGAVDLYNQQYAEKYNVEFVLDELGQLYDFRIGFCQMVNIRDGGEESSYSLLSGKDAYISAGSNSIRDPNTLLHEFGHDSGSLHPFDVGIDATRCSNFASVMCYGNAMDIMLPLGNSTKPVTLSDPTGLAVQDHKLAKFIFGNNPNYQPHDIQTNVTLGAARMIVGDPAFNNSAILDSSSLPQGVKYAVLDAATAIGTCYQFPCELKNLAEGMEGTLLILYKEQVSGNPEIMGNVLLFGGKTNDVIIDGRKVEPVGLDSQYLTSSPVTLPTSRPTFTSKDDLTLRPSSKPSGFPTYHPTAGDLMTTNPTSLPTGAPTLTSIQKQTYRPSEIPTYKPSSNIFSSSPTVAAASDLKNSDPNYIEIIGGSVAALTLLGLAYACYLRSKNTQSYRVLDGSDSTNDLIPSSNVEAPNASTFEMVQNPLTK